MNFWSFLSTITFFTATILHFAEVSPDPKNKGK